MQQTDLLVVGAGFAGLSCAAAAAARGVRTLVLDRKPEAGANPHTTGILVKELADEWDVPRALTRKIRGIRLYSPALDHLDLRAPGYYFLATDTPALMNWLARQAENAGAGLRFRASVTAAEQRDDGRVVLPQQGLNGSFLVGCDGARSAVARALGLGQNQHFLFGVEAELASQTLADNWFHVFLDSRLAPGYIGWVVPGVGVTQVGLAARRPHRPRLDKFIEKITDVVGLTNNAAISYRAGLIPCGGTVRPLARGNAMVLGDAAGMVSPLTAGGIHPAMQLGRIAGVSIADYLLDDGVHPVRNVRQAMPSFFFKRGLRSAYDVCPFTDLLFDAALGTPWFRALAQTVFFHHRGLLSPQAWRDMFGLVR
jgi:flavin-dependent dehydrogenase